MPLIVTNGDLIKLAEDGRFNVIVHGCNCFCTMGSGIARQIRERYPEAYTEDCKTVAGDAGKLGTYTVMLGKRFNIVNAYTQYGYNRAGKSDDLFEYDAFAQILNQLAEQYPTCSFGFPAIGMGLAGGNKERILGMLEDFADAVESTGGIVTLVIYDK